MKILNLVIYSESTNKEGYENMQCMLANYYQKFEPDIKTIFVKHTENIPSEFLLDGNILHIKGPETIIPGILNKTLKAFEFFTSVDFDYVIRSNISSIIDFNLLAKILQQYPVDFYGGAGLGNLQWEGGGITDNTWYGTIFAFGTCIILTKAAVNFILDNKHLMHYDIIDDVSIGILMREYKHDITPKSLHSDYWKTTPVFFSNDGFHKNQLIEYVHKNNIVVYRNKCSNCRKVDEIQMQVIIDVLTAKQTFHIHEHIFI